jgi:hypothetical protein
MSYPVTFTAGVWNDEKGWAIDALFFGGKLTWWVVVPAKNPRLELCVKPNELRFTEQPEGWGCMI